jgi:hypothetical protein
MKTVSAHTAGNDARDVQLQHYRSFFPFATLKCVGRPLYRSQEARDYACLLDLDPTVLSWRSVTRPITNDSGARKPRKHFIDFAVETADERILVDVRATEVGIINWISRTAERHGYCYRAVLMSELSKGPRLQNARDLVRYAGCDAPLGDRIRILAALDEMGTLSLAECLSAVREGRPMQTVAAMILAGVIDVDLDEALLGPDTVVRRATK